MEYKIVDIEEVRMRAKIRDAEYIASTVTRINNELLEFGTAITYNTRISKMYELSGFLITTHRPYEYEISLPV